MLEKYFFEILTGLIFVISLMSTVIFFLLKKIKVQKENENKKAQRLKEKEKFILESLDIICRAISEGQCELSEGCIRIRMLMTKSQMIISDKENFKVIFSMYEKLKDFKTHESRNDLTAKERFKEDSLRISIEDQYKEPFVTAVRELLVDVKEFL
jgi:hypothetical protein